MAGKEHWVSVSWGDHLSFGEGDGRLDTPEKLKRRLDAWREELGARVVLWRENRSRLGGWVYSGDEPPRRVMSPAVPWDDFATVCEAAHRREMRVYLYVTLFDEGWPLPPPAVRRISYHNAYHARDVSWQSDFSRRHPEYAVTDRSGRKRQWGVLCLAYPEVRGEFRRRFRGLLSQGDFDGLFVCLRSQSKPAAHADEFGFNPPVVAEYRRRHGVDIRRDPFDVQAWRDLLGDFLTLFLEELREDLDRRRLHLAVGVPRGRIIGPPIGNWTLAWDDWLRRGLVDELVVDQDSTRCPSTWLDLWPMHRGRGYLEPFREKRRPLRKELQLEYLPVVRKSRCRLLLARQWYPRDELEEQALLEEEGVGGLVFSSFRHDNPDVVARNDWRPRHERIRSENVA
ncbi:MAG: hypothetical protein Kow00109_16640 [Acidobacteriota bacterium]